MRALPAGSRGASLLLILFSLPFTGVGLFMGWLTFSTLAEWRDAAGWAEAPAFILEAELERHSDDDGTTCETTAHYRYTYKDHTYESRHVSLHSGADNIGDFHERIYGELKPYIGSEVPFHCFVNPNAPAQALLYREMRWEMVAFYLVFGIIFGGAGIAILFAGVRADGAPAKPAGAAVIRTAKARPPRSAAKAKPAPAAAVKARPVLSAPAPDSAPPDTPPDGRISAGSQGMAFGLTAFALFWLLVTSPVLFVLREEVVDNGNYLALLALVFPLVGVLLLGAAIHRILHWRKFGEVMLILDPPRVEVGGELRGHIDVPAPLESPNGVQLRLSCLRVVTTKSGDETSTHEEPIREEQAVAAVTAWGRQRTEIPVRFAIPADAEPSGAPNANDKVVWRLLATADLPGIDLDVKFEVPVVRPGGR